MTPEGLVEYKMRARAWIPTRFPRNACDATLAELEEGRCGVADLLSAL